MLTSLWPSNGEQPVWELTPADWQFILSINLGGVVNGVAAFVPRMVVCGGPAPLARREVIIAMQEFLKAIPQFHIKPGAKITTLLGGTIQPDCLPLIY